MLPPLFSTNVTDNMRFVCRTDTDYDDALIAKLYIFMFVNSYAALFFVAFIKVSGL
jgi:hypothetical protein